MMRFDGTDGNDRSLYAGLPGDIAVSFELFPPKTAAGMDQLRQTVDRLKPCAPSFVSVTYGAGGSTRDGTITTLRALLAETSLPVAGHLTCVGASRAEVDEVAEQYSEAGITRIVALRGDGGPPGTTFTPHPDGYQSAAELVGSLAKRGTFDISVAAYPETHPDAHSPEADLDNLKRKLDAGATRALTQFFFAPETFLRFRDRAAAAGITAPIVPGVLPITNFAQTRRFAEACGTDIPAWIAKLFEDLDDQPETRLLVAAATAAELCSQLYAGGVREFHFYTLNRADLARALCHLLGKRASSALDAAA